MPYHLRMGAGGTSFPRWMNASLLPHVVRRQRPVVRLALAFVGIFLGIVASNLVSSPTGGSGPLHVVVAMLGVAGVWWFVSVFTDLFMSDYGSRQLPMVSLAGAGAGFVSGYLGSSYRPLTNALIGSVVLGALALATGWIVLIMRRRLPPPPGNEPPGHGTSDT